MHAERARRWGDPQYVIARPTRAERGCVVQGCSQPHNAKGLCKEHYDLWIRNGAPQARQRRKRGTGHVNAQGYVILMSRRAHRAIAQAPADLVVHHRDGNPGNNDPANLVLMTASEHGRLHAERRFTSETGRAAALKRWHRQ